MMVGCASCMENKTLDFLLSIKNTQGKLLFRPLRKSGPGLGHPGRFGSLASGSGTCPGVQEVFLYDGVRCSLMMTERIRLPSSSAGSVLVSLAEKGLWQQGAQ